MTQDVVSVIALERTNLSDEGTNNSNISFSTDSYSSIQYVMWRSIVILSVNCLLGCLGNSIVVLVYGNKNFNNSSDIFIFILGCLDLSMCLFYMPVSVYELFTDSEALPICIIDKGGAFYYTSTSFALFFCIALDRNIAVMKPYDYKTIMSTGRAKKIVAFCLTFGLACALPIAKTCLTESTLDDQKQFRIFMKAYAAAVIALTVFLTVSYINVFIVARRATLVKPTNLVPMRENYAPMQTTSSKSDKVSDKKDSPGAEKPTRVGLQQEPQGSHHKNSINNTGTSQIQETEISAARQDENLCARNTNTAPAVEDEEKGDTKEEIRNFEEMKRKRSLKKQWQIALTLFLVTFTFIVCYIPSALLDLKAWGLEIDFKLEREGREVLLGLFWFSVPANPVIYAFTSTRFRSDAKLMLTRMRSCDIASI